MEKLLASRLEGNPKVDAGTLLGKFGTLRSLVASARRNSGKPASSEGQLIDLIAASCALVEQALEESVSSRSMFLDDDDFKRLLRLKIGMQTEEHCFAVYMAPGCRISRMELVALGGRRGVGLPCGSIVRRAVELNALGVILAHNHPSGDARPSQADIAATAEIKRRLSDAEVVLIDHLVVTADDVFSIHQNRIFQ